MSNTGDRERQTQMRVLQFLAADEPEGLGYQYLGDWQCREGNSNIEVQRLSDWLASQGHDDKIIGKVLHELDRAKTVSGSKTLYEANKAVYGLLRYGVKVPPDSGEKKITVWLVDWNNPRNNDFAVAEEVTVAGLNEKRPDIVLYVNGIALGVLELKRSTVSVTEGIRQNLDNQKKEFIRPFFATMQLVMAGNDTEGLRYGVIETREKYWLNWKEESPSWKPSDPADTKYLPEDRIVEVPQSEAKGRLNCGLARLVNKERFLKLVHDFIVFDAGTKKTCRHNQFFGVRATVEHVRRREGGIVWHTQGSGKSLAMVWLAKWISDTRHATSIKTLPHRRRSMNGLM